MVLGAWQFSKQSDAKAYKDESLFYERLPQEVVQKQVVPQEVVKREIVEQLVERLQKKETNKKETDKIRAIDMEPLQQETEKAELSPVDLILHIMRWGNIAFNAPTSINLDETAHIQLLLGIKQTIEELKQDIKVEIEKKHLSGDIEVARIKVAPRIMQAHLEGYSFDIKSITPDEQLISSEVKTEWLWEVIPKVAGKNILYLTLNAKLPIDGSSAYRTISTFKKEIRVEVTRLQQTKNFIKDNWQWLWTAIFFPIGAWLWSKRGSSSATKAAHLRWRQKINKQKD
jgi:hypothetical protein